MNTRVLIVDDSVFMRSMLKSVLSGAEDLEVVGTAQNGIEILKRISALKPDVLTLDIEMPGLNGLEVLAQVMDSCPLPVVMVSASTHLGTQASLNALRLGAIECVAKPAGDKCTIEDGFRVKVLRAVRRAAQCNPSAHGVVGLVRAPYLPVFPLEETPGVVIAIGISAGGPLTLHQMIPAFSRQTPPIVITQHMPADFTGPFASRLNEIAKLDVKEAQEGDELISGRALIAPGSRHLRVVRKAGRLVVSLDDGPKVGGFRPAVDVMFESVAVAAGPLAIALVMTGMGSDGSIGVQIIKRHGGFTIAQDAESSVVYGMPKAAVQTGCIDGVETLNRIPQAIAERIRRVRASANTNKAREPRVAEVKVDN